MIRVLLFLILALLPLTAQADVPDTDRFARLPVIHDGRMKPVESFARIHLLRFSGQRHLEGETPARWLAELLFDPAGAAERPVFKIRDLEIKGILNLPARANHLYSFAEINPGLAASTDRIRTLALKKPDDLTPPQAALLKLQEDAVLYTQMMRSFSLILPLNVTVPDTLSDAGAAAPNYLDLQKLRKKAEDRLAGIMKRKGDDIETWSAEERSIAAFAWQMQVMDDSGAGNIFFRVIPSEGNWFSPWALVEEGRGTPEATQILDQWKLMANAWISADAPGFEAAASRAQNLLAESGRVTPASRARLEAEIVYQKFRPLDLALALYALSLIAFAVSARRANFAGLAAALGMGGALLHICGIATRIYILARPPVGTLYESLIFVSLICALSALVIRKNPLAALTGLAAAASLLYLSGSFLPASGDSLEMLVAVLNTNFWLATHVTCITAGYGFSILAGALAHLWLIMLATNRPATALFPLLQKTALTALLFTTVGTILGGIWADQSWGRFWGWDPKENGALLIVLWLLWLLHGRMAGILKQTAYAAGLAFITVIVALAWFGVNLLSVGLHSYGFTSGIAWSLGLFCAVEIALIASLTMFAMKARP